MNQVKTGMGRGTLYLMLASGVFLATGYVIHFGLGRYLGPEIYGIFGVVLALMSTVHLLLTTGFPQGASKHIAEDNAGAGSIIRESTKIQVLLSLLVFALYFGLAGVIADLLNDPTLTPYIRISSLVIPAYALYSVYNNGYLNGLRRFGQQAKTTILSSLVKVGAVFALIFLGLSVTGAILGYLVAALVGFLLALKYLGPVEKSSANFKWSKLIKFGIPATLVSVVLFLLMSIDLFVVKALLAADVDTGYYTSAATLAKIPYFIFGGLALTLLPSISRSTSINDARLTRSYIHQSLRYMLMLLIPVVLVMSATSDELISLVYSSRYIEAAKPFSLLIFGLGFLTVFLVLANIIMGSGKPHIAMGIALPLVPLDIVLNLFLIPRYGLPGAALATTITAALGMVIAAVYVLVRFRTLVGIRSLLKICLASLVVYAVSLQISLSALFLPFIYLSLAALYSGILLLTKEIDREDLQTFKRIIPIEGFM